MNLADGRDSVAVVLAIGLSIAVNLITAGVLYDAIFSEGPGLSDNATQLLTTAFGGIIGVVGSYLGYRMAISNQRTIDRTGESVVNTQQEAPDLNE